ncbi:MAG TPA: lytic murein transglycosylase [Solirubrobacterales bacterium]
MGRLAAICAGVCLLLAIAAPGALAETEPALPPVPAAPPEASGEEESASQTAAPAPTPSVKQGETLTAPPKPRTEGGAVTAKPKPSPAPRPDPQTSDPEPEESGGTASPPVAPPSFLIPSIPSGSCVPGAVPPVLIPIYQRASDAYELGPQGPSVLAAINLIETAFGTNLNVSSAGAVGWMQFMPGTWEAYGVDADGDGVRDPYDPEDAIFAAANYLNASGAPTDWYGAIFAYNHADWYVADVLANAECFGRLGSAVAAAFDLSPKMQVLDCNPARRWRKRIPAEYMAAFEGAAARYDLGQRGVWVLAAVARLESDFGRGMTKAELRRRGPLGLDGAEWLYFTVDGDGDGRISHADPDDSAATMARMIWSRGTLRAGLFTHNQAKWYVEAVLAEASRIEGRCEVSTVDWALALPNVVIAPINWENLTITNQVAQEDLEAGLIDPRIVGLIGAITQRHSITISSLRSDHSMFTVAGGISNHYYGRAMDIASVDGVSCTDTSPTAPCAELTRTLAYLPSPAMPTELIYCFDVDGPGPAFARADHCDHIHAGYDG